MVSLILGDVMVRLMMKIFSNNLLINISFSLITIKLNLINNTLSGLASIKFS